MKNRNIIICAILVLAAVLVFSACNKSKDDVIYITDANGQTVLDALGRPVTIPVTEAPGTSIVHVTEVKIGDDGQPVTDNEGSYVFVPKTELVSEVVTDKAGEAMTEAVTDKSGEAVTEAGGEIVTEVVTSVHTVEVTEIVQLTAPVQKVSEIKAEKPSKTTAVYDNPAYDETKTQNNITFPTNPSLPGYKIEKKTPATIGGTLSDRLVDIELLSDGSSVRLINTSSKNGSFLGAPKTIMAPYSLLMKINADGTVGWTVYLGGANGGTALDEIARLSDGSFIAVGYSEADDLTEDWHGDYEAVMFKISAKGELLWTKAFGSTEADYFSSVAACADGGFVTGGKFFAIDGTFKDLAFEQTRAIVSKFNADGELVWSKAFGGSRFEDFDRVVIGSDGSIYAAGESTSFDGELNGAPKNTNVAIAKYSAKGEKLWSKFIGGSGYDRLNDMIAVKDGVVLVGSTSALAAVDGSFKGLVNRGGTDAFLLKLATDGSTKLIQTYGGFGDDSFIGVAATSYGYVVCGTSYSSNRDLSAVGNKGECDAITMVITADGKVVGVDSLAGSKRDTPAVIAAKGDNSFIIIGNTFSTDGGFTGIIPSATASGCIAYSAQYTVTRKY